MKKEFDFEALKAIEEVSEEELTEMVGAMGDGVLYSITHECYMNSFQFLGTCCGW